MERMRSIPVDLILHETALKLRELPEEHHRGLAGDIRATCIFPYGVAEQWANGAGVCQSAAWIVRRLDPASGGPVFPAHISAETRAMEVAIARRLADCALSLLVTQDPEDAATAQTLLQAAQRVVGLATAKPHAEVGSTANGLLHRLVAALNLNPGTPESEALATAAKLASGAVYLDRLRDSDGLLAAAIKREQDIATALRLPVIASQADIVARARSLADADAARLAAEAENANKASTIAKQESIIANLTRERDTWSSWATKLAGQWHEQSSSKALREVLSGRLIDSKGQRLKVARDCLPPGVDIIACLRDDKPTTYKSSNTGEEYDTPEAAVRAAWEHHQRPAQPVPAPTFKVGDKVVVARRASSNTCDWYDNTDGHFLGETCAIAHVDDDGDLAVYHPNGDSTWLAPNCVDLVTPTA